ncbi:hypothetical protein HGRIS_006955 [Hohenbuehelia grisea]|uniref:Uncharacterized protein n=1 Tax=Hohenbuehelia grisea TaxID=104357 RepID=A0ABR3JAW9_9AGAR
MSTFEKASHFTLTGATFNNVGGNQTSTTTTHNIETASYEEGGTYNTNTGSGHMSSASGHAVHFSETKNAATTMTSKATSPLSTKATSARGAVVTPLAARKRRKATASLAMARNLPTQAGQPRPGRTVNDNYYGILTSASDHATVVVGDGPSSEDAERLLKLRADERPSTGRQTRQDTHNINVRGVFHSASGHATCFLPSQQETSDDGTSSHEDLLKLINAMGSPLTTENVNVTRNLMGRTVATATDTSFVHISASPKAAEATKPSHVPGCQCEPCLEVTRSSAPLHTNVPMPPQDPHLAYLMSAVAANPNLLRQLWQNVSSNSDQLNMNAGNVGASDIVIDDADEEYVDAPDGSIPTEDSRGGH